MGEIDSERSHILKYFASWESGYVETEILLPQSRLSEPVTDSLLTNARRSNNHYCRFVRVSFATKQFVE